jgi:tetratricopeptide (TPR) repeat protein
VKQNIDKTRLSVNSVATQKKVPSPVLPESLIRKNSWWDRNSSYLLVGILLLTFTLYAGSLKNGFTNWDDDKYITQNVLVKNLSWRNVAAMFTAFYAGNYHPLVAMSNAIEYSIFGLNPKPYHTLNLLLHLANTVLVYFFIWRFSRKKGLALASALLFALHPMHVESVAWLSERKDLLYAFFFLLSLLSYGKYLEDVRNKKYLYFCGVLFLFSLLSKSAALVLPFVLLLLDYLEGRFITWKVLGEKRERVPILEKIPFFALSLLFGYLALLSQKASINVVTIDRPEVFTWWEHVFLASYAILFYIVEFFFPLHLSALHLFPIKEGGLLPWEYYMAPFLLIALVFGLSKVREGKKEVLFGFLFFAFTIVLVLQFVPVGQAIVSDRYTYLPYVGLFLCTVGVGRHLFMSLKEEQKEWVWMGYVVGIGYLLWFGILTVERCAVWKNSESLFTDMIKSNPDTKIAYQNRGVAKLDMGNYEGAFLDFNKAIELAPTYAEAYYNRGLAASMLRNGPQALSDYTQAIAIKPDYAVAYYNRGNVKVAMKDQKGAMLDYEKAFQLEPYNAEALFNYATLKMAENDYITALEYYEKAIAVRPNYEKAILNRDKLKQLQEENLKAISNN